MYTLIYAILHFMVDGICSLSMYGWLTKYSYEHWLFLIFFFCAYVLQLPFGILADRLVRDKEPEEQESCLARFCWMGIILTVAGACSTPVILGVGSALFHIGSTGGMILEDRNHEWKGCVFGVYLAPGMVADYLAQKFVAEYSLKDVHFIFLIACGSILIWIAAFEIGLLIRKKRRKSGVVYQPMVPAERIRLPEKKKWDIPIAVSCFLVAMLHYNLGETMEFTWRSGITLGLLGVIAVAAGKVVGGLLNARFGPCPTMFISMLAAAVLFCFGEFPSAGLMAFLAYNMLVPVTVYIMAEQFPSLPGLVAGIVACAMFPGYLPGWMEIEYTIAGIPISHSLLGSLSSMIFLALLLIAGWLADRE